MPEITRQQIIAAARFYALAKTPYKPGGQDASGLNCAGLMVAIARDTGYLTEEIPGFATFNEAEPMQKWFGKYLEPVESFEDVLPGDVVSMFRGEGTDGQHCAMLTEKDERGLKYGLVVHVLRNHGCVEGRLFGKYLAEVTGFYRLRGIVD